MPTYDWYATPEGCLLVERGTPGLEAATVHALHGGSFEAADHATARAELVRLMDELRARMEARK